MSDSKDVRGPIAWMARNSVAANLLMIVLLVVAVQITKPIERLAQAVRRMAQGDLDARVDIKSRDEIGEFAQAFNGMLDDLKKHIDALTRETAAREAVESELRVARSIQASLLPRVFPPYPDREEFDLHALNISAKEVAGDFFDYFFVNKDVLAIVMADVSGKGVPAALFMAVTRTLIKNLATSDLPPRDVIIRANRILLEDNDRGMFVTLFLGYYDTRTGELTYVNAGHNPPYRVSASGALECFGKASGPPLGVFDLLSYEEQRITLDIGELLVLYTDGVTEAQAPNGEMLEEEGLEELLKANASQPVGKVCAVIVERVEEFQEGILHDDVTILALRRLK